MLADLPIDAAPFGWPRSEWIVHCHRMANACREFRPELAADWERRANAVEAAGEKADDE